MQTVKEIRINFFMQNLPKIKTKKVTPFKSNFLESITKTKIATSIHSENEDTLLKVNSYDPLKLHRNGNEENHHFTPKESKNMGMIKRDFKKIFNNNIQIREKEIIKTENASKNRDSFSIQEENRRNEKNDQKILMEKRRNADLPNLNSIDFKKYLNKKIKDRKWTQTGGSSSLLKSFQEAEGEKHAIN